MRRNAWRSMTVLLVGSLVALAPVLTPSANAAAPGYPVDICSTISVSTTTPQQGERIGVTGVNFLPDTNVALKLKPAPGNTASIDPMYNLKTVRSDAQGSFATTVVMPEATHSRGRFIIFAATGARNGTSCPADPQVQLNAGSDNTNNNNNNPNGGPNETAFTGLNVLVLLLIAAALIAVGIAATRRGRTVTTMSIHH